MKLNSRIFFGKACLWSIFITQLALAESAPRDTLLMLPDSAAQAADHEVKAKEFEASLHYRHGHILLGDGLAGITLDANAAYLDPNESEKILVDLWGNPPGFETLGMIFPEGQKATTPGGWAVILSYEEDGYVKDDDADKLDYADLLKTMKKDVKASNEERRKQGYGTVDLLGWAENPHYDSSHHKLYWAKALQFENAADTTLNYNVRILGRRGVLVLNAVADIRQLTTVRAGMLPIMQSIEFEQGHRYADFDPKLDKVATYGIAGLVAGAALLKVGFLKGLIGILFAAKKFLILGGVAAVAFIGKFLGNRKQQKEIPDDQVRRIDDGRA